MKITLLTGKTFEIERAAGLPLKVVSPPRCRRLALRSDPKERQAAFLPRRVRDFIRREAAGRLLELSRQKAALIGCRVNRVTIKDTKSRWGSCSSLNNINYNWRIALAPMNAIDYLIAHETAHLRHRDHSKAFWNCVKTLCPFAESGRRWLKQNGGLLYAYE